MHFANLSYAEGGLRKNLSQNVAKVMIPPAPPRPPLFKNLRDIRYFLSALPGVPRQAQVDLATDGAVLRGGKAWGGEKRKEESKRGEG